MFGIFKKKNAAETNSSSKLELFSPLTGKSIPLGQVEDMVFSQKMVGDGMAIIPTDGKVYAPVDGTLVQVFKTKHAYSITTEDGLEILIHCGLDTVELGGEGFTAYKNSGDSIKKGDLLAEMDLDFIASKGKETVTPVVITNMDEFSGIVGEGNEVTAGELLFTVEK